MDSQHHPSQQMASIQPSVRLSGFPQRIARCDRHAGSTAAEMTIQLVEFTRVRDRIEGTHAEGAPLHGNRFDAVRVHDASPGAHEVETPFELVAAGERQHSIQSIGRELPELLNGGRTPRVDHTIGTERSDQTGRRGAGCGRDDAGPSLNGKLNRHRADGARGAEDQHGLSGPQFERVDALECSQSRGGNRTGSAQVESFRHAAHVRGVRDGELRVEATLPVAELVRVDPVTEPNPPDAGAFGDDHAGAVNPRHQRESRPTGRSP